MQHEVQQGKVGISPNTSSLTRAVGIGYGLGPDGCRRAVREAIEELGFDLRVLRDGGALDVWIEAALDTPLEQLIPGIHAIHDAVGAPIDCEVEFEFSEERAGDVVVELIAWSPR